MKSESSDIQKLNRLTLSFSALNGSYCLQLLCCGVTYLPSSSLLLGSPPHHQPAALLSNQARAPHKTTGRAAADPSFLDAPI